jgi:uncharacterized membrane protein YphA (DoxX/SURF4 family)
MEGPAIQNRNALMKIVTFSWLSKATLVEIISILYSILFLYTAVSKLMEFDVFQEQIAENPLLEPVAPFIAWSVPIIEIILSIILFIPQWRLKGLYASLALMVAFTIYIGAIMIFNDKLPCSCGGIVSQLSWNGHLIFNSIFILLAFACIRMERRLRRTA